MTFLYPLLTWVTLIISCTATKRDRLIDWLEVVPHLENLENFYVQIRSQNGSKSRKLFEKLTVYLTHLLIISYT